MPAEQVVGPSERWALLLEDLASAPELGARGLPIERRKRQRYHWCQILFDAVVLRLQARKVQAETVAGAALVLMRMEQMTM